MNQKPKKAVSALLPPDIYEKLKARAEREHRTLSACIRRAVKFWLEAEK